MTTVFDAYVAKWPRKAAATAEKLSASEDARDRERGAAFAAALRSAKRCRCCGIALEDPESVRLGIGPTCRKKEA